MRFIVDQTQTPNLKVKVAILRYIEALARQMDPADFVNSSETRLAVSRIITWTTEPKSSDVRKVGGGGAEVSVPTPFSPYTQLSFSYFQLPLCFLFICKFSFSLFHFLFSRLVVSNRHFSSTNSPRPFITGQGRISQADPAPWPLCLGRETRRRGASR